MNDDPNQQQPPPPPPPETGPVRVYDRPDVPPSAVRRKRLTIAIAVVGVLISLLLLFLGPLRSVLGGRSDTEWTPSPITTSGVITATVGITGTPAGTPAATWTPGVDLGALKGSPTALPTLAPAATTTPLPPTATVALPTQPATAVPTDAPTAEPTAVATVVTGLPANISGGRALAFVSDRTGAPQVWVMDASGGSQTQVTTVGRNTSPAWSADNRYLYYVGERDGQTAVYRLDITTGREERVASEPGLVSARPLPTGQLAVVRMEQGRHTLYIDDRRLFQLDRAFQFQFSPDGARVLIDPTAAPRVITVVDVATTQAAEIAPANAWNATWGQANRFAFVSDRTGVAAVYVANGDGSDPTAVTPGDKWSQAPAFSPDGGRIAFIGGDGPAWNVYVVPATGGNAQRVGGPANPGKGPLWQPGGALIAFESDRSGNADIYVTDPQGHERALTTTSGNDTDPAWTW